MRRTNKFFILGFFFFMVIIFFGARSGLSSDFFSYLGVATVVAVGLLKDAKTGLAFGLSSSVAYLFYYLLIGDYFWYSPLGSLLSIFVSAIVFGLFGYWPSKYYLQSKRASTLVKIFVGTIILGLVINILATIVAYVLISDYYWWFSDFMAFSLPQMLYWAIGVLIFGGISAALCVRRINRATAPTPPIVQPPFPGFVKPVVRSVTCSQCGSDNPEGYDFCGRCGKRLRQDETRIY